MSQIVGYVHEAMDRFMSVAVFEAWAAQRATAAELDQWRPVTWADGQGNEVVNLRQERAVKMLPSPNVEGAGEGVPFGYVSEHNCQGPFRLQFHKDTSDIYPDNCLSITPVYITPSPQATALPNGWPTQEMVLAGAKILINATNLLDVEEGLKLALAAAPITRLRATAATSTAASSTTTTASACATSGETTMTSVTEAMPCPHCGNAGTRDPRHTFNWNHMQRTVSVQCGQCLATGPFARLLRSGRRAEDEALRLWNERKTPNAEFTGPTRP